MIKDSFGRVHDYLRISLTDNCNLRCFYCMPDEDHQSLQSSKLMQAAEINQLAELFVREGVTKIRLTGGEPLVRKDASQIISSLSRLPVQLTLTTNGVRIHEHMDTLKNSSIHSVNVSLDTLHADKFQLLTRRNLFQQVTDNIALLIRHHIHVKVNVVVMKGINEAEINDFIEWTKDQPVHVRFIEFMPFSGNHWKSASVFTLKEILQEAAKRYSFIPLKGHPNDTAKAFQAEGHTGTFAVISTMSEPFCAGCNRMRLTADGKLKNCLFSKEETDLLSPLREGKEVTALIHDTIYKKAKELGGQFSAAYENLEPDAIHNRSMIAIGG